MSASSQAHSAPARTTTVPVTAIIPAFNRARYIERAIRSVLDQRPHPPDELIVVDDGSTDETANLAHAAGARVIRHEHNRGSAAARNTAVEAAKHRWIAPLDSDDEWLPNHLATIFPLREGHAFVAGASFAVADGNAGRSYAGVVDSVIIRSPAALALENFVNASGVIFDSHVSRAVGGYSEHRRNAEDLDLWLRVLERGTGLCIPEPVSIYHRHENQKSGGGRVTRATVRELIDSYSGRPWCTPEVRERRHATDRWDDLREALAVREWDVAARSAGFLIGRPRRLAAVAELVYRRQRRRAHGKRLDRVADPKT